MNKTADTDHTIQNILATRWSPYCFDDTVVSSQDLSSLFEAARWAPSSYNEQPWRFIVGQRGRGTTHARILKCLAEPNQRWAQRAPVLALGVVVNEFEKNGKPNRAAHHDLGLAVGNLLMEATARGLHVHQMIGVDSEAAAKEFGVPVSAEVLTALAIGRADRSATRDAELAPRDDSPRSRRPLNEFVYGERYGEAGQL